jgi:hypothetical protein
MCKKQNNKIQNQNNYVDLGQRYVELLRVHNQLMNQDEICPDCMYSQLLSNTSQSFDLLDDLKNEIDNDQLSSESEEEIISDCKIMDTITNKNKHKKNKIIITFE